MPPGDKTSTTINQPGPQGSEQIKVPRGQGWLTTYNRVSSKKSLYAKTGSFSAQIRDLTPSSAF